MLEVYRSVSESYLTRCQLPSLNAVRDRLNGFTAPAGQRLQSRTAFVCRDILSQGSRPAQKLGSVFRACHVIYGKLNDDVPTFHVR